jgi:hypothetical protein
MSTDEPYEPIIDPLLEEALGGVAPPDLSARIVEAWSQRQTSQRQALGSLSTGSPAGPPLSAYDLTDPLPPPVQINEAPRPVVVPDRGVDGKRGAKRRRAEKTWLPALATVAALAAVLMLAAIGFRDRPGLWPEVAQPQEHDPSRPRDPQFVRVPGDGRPGAENASPTPSTDANPDANIVRPEESTSPSADNIAQVPPFGSGSPFSESDPIPSPPRTPARDPMPDEQMVALINLELQAGWEKHGVTPSPRATDAEWCRRTFLRILGRIPTVEELQAFTDDSSSDKFEKLVDHLLTDSRYAEEYARHWADVWANVLIGRAVGSGRGEVASREGLELYLRESLLENKPYDRIALELISATGSGQPGTDNFNGAANFLLAHATDDGTVATARTSRVFLGVQLQCVQCHDHPTAPLDQSRFWAMNAFFRQMKVTGNRNDPRVLVDRDYLGYDGHDEHGLVFYERPNGLMKAAGPAFLDGAQPKVSGGRVSEVNRRRELARMVVESDYFSKAAVNRVWSHFLGYGFTRPVDDLAAAEPSHPQLLERVADEFEVRNHDLKSLMRWIALSDAFNRSSKLTGEQVADMPEAGATALFSRYYTRPLHAEEVFRSLQIAAKLRQETGSGGNIEQARVAWLAQVHKDDEADTGPTLQPAIVQLNAALVRRATTHASDNMLHTVSRSDLPFEAKVEHLFLAALSRKPNGKELELARTLAGMNGQNESAALEDIWWALLNSNEFILDH